jgi:hypothetical protein
MLDYEFKEEDKEEQMLLLEDIEYTSNFFRNLNLNFVVDDEIIAKKLQKSENEKFDFQLARNLQKEEQIPDEKLARLLQENEEYEINNEDYQIAKFLQEEEERVAKNQNNKNNSGISYERTDSNNIRENYENTNDLSIQIQDNDNLEYMSYEELLELEERNGKIKVGLSKGQIEQLPSSIFRLKNNNEECTICFQDYQEGNELLHLPCLHFYHKECIKRWLCENKNCPICKNEIIF